MATLPDGPFDGVIVANELLDNLPVPAVRVRRRLARGVRHCRRRRWPFAEVLSAPLDPPPAVLPAAPPHGSRAAAARRRRRLGRATPGRGCAAAGCSPSTTPGRRRPRWRCGRGGEWLRTYREPRSRRPLPRRRRGARTSRSRSPSTSSPSRTPVAHAGAVPAAVGHRRARRRGRATVGRQRCTPPTSPRWRCAAGSSRPRRCSTRPGSGAFVAAEWSGTFCATMSTHVCRGRVGLAAATLVGCDAGRRRHVVHAARRRVRRRPSAPERRRPRHGNHDARRRRRRSRATTTDVRRRCPPPADAGERSGAHAGAEHRRRRRAC